MSCGRSRGSGLVSRMTWPMSTAPTPSTIAWWVLLMMANRLSAAPPRGTSPTAAGTGPAGGLQPGDQLGQLLVAARPGQRRPAYVVGDVEVLVVHPDRVGQPPGTQRIRCR